MDRLKISGKLIATDITMASSAFHAADLGLLVPPIGHADYVTSLLKIVEKHQVKLLVPLTDLDLRSLAHHREQFQDIGCTVMVASEQVVSLCRDKKRTNAMLDEAGLATIKTLSLDEFEAMPFYPCFVKPVQGSAGVGGARIANDKELRAHVATFGELLIVQEYVPGREFTMDVYRTRDGQVPCVVPRQRLQVRSGEVEHAITVNDETLIQLTVRLSQFLGDLWGVFCCQCRRDDDGRVRFFEINPRFGGGVPLSIAAGADLPFYLLEELLGRPVSAKLGQFADHLLMLRYDEAVFTRATDPDDLPGYETPRFR